MSTTTTPIRTAPEDERPPGPEGSGGRVFGGLFDPRQR